MTEAVLELEGVTKRFGAVTAADAVTLDLRSREIHALIGPNGAGKSTLIQLTAGGLAPDAGLVRLSGRDVTTLGAAARAQKGLGRTFQVSSLAMDFTVLQNVVLGALGANGYVMRFFAPIMGDAELRDRAMAARPYHQTVFLAPPWEALFANDAERRHSFEDAVAEHDRLGPAYAELGYRVVPLPKTGVAERVAFVNNTLKRGPT